MILEAAAPPVNAALSHDGFSPLARANQAVASTRLFQAYQVKSGDTLWAIAQQYQVDLGTLMQSNHLDSSSVLRIGQNLKLPQNDSPVHIIRAGETLWDIAQGSGSTVQQLLQLNPGKNPNNLKIGDSLVLPRGKGVLLAAKSPSRGSFGSSLILSWPVIGPITSSFGWRSGGFHHGIDIAAPRGEPVKAAAAGEVSFTGTKVIYGKTIIVDISPSQQNLYAHLQQINVREGQKIKKGQVIGQVGTTGNSTGPHLHFEYRQNQKTYNPLTYLK